MTLQHWKFDENDLSACPVGRLSASLWPVAGHHAHALGAVDHRALRPKTHRNLMIATLLCEMLGKLG